MSLWGGEAGAFRFFVEVLTVRVQFGNFPCNGVEFGGDFGNVADRLAVLSCTVVHTFDADVLVLPDREGQLVVTAIWG